MAQITQLSTSSLSNQNISAALLVHTLTNTTRIREIQIGITLDQVTGGGDYQAWVEIQIAGAGSFFESAKMVKTALTGQTKVLFQSMWFSTITSTDVIKVWVLGLAGDTATPDIVTYINEKYLDDTGASFTSIPNSAGVATLLAALVPVVGAQVTDAGATTTVFKTNLASAVVDYYKGMAVVFTSGALTGQLGQIKSYSGAPNQTVTLQSALTSAPANLVTFDVVSVAASRKFADFLAACDTSGRVNVGLWLDVVPAILTATGKYLQVALERWLTDDAAGTPAALTATGHFLQAVLERWLTDNAAGTPLALTATHLVQADAIALNGGVPSNLTAQDVWDALVVALATPGSIGEFVVAFLDEIEHKVDDNQALIMTK